MTKLVNIASYYGLSMDFIISGQTAGKNALEQDLNQATANEPTIPFYSRSGTFISRFHALPSQQKERVIGYLDALYREI